MNEKENRQKPRLGLINFVNSLPIVLPLLEENASIEGSLFLAQPSKLNAMFAAGEIDYGAMSAFAYLQQSDSLQLIPNVSISSQDAVNSVLLFSKKSIVKHAPAKVAVPLSSATSINAMSLMLLQFSSTRPSLVATETPDLTNAQFDAALVIGDQALLVDDEWSAKYYRYDLGEWWRASFNLPMVFGVFAVRKDWLFNAASQSDEQSAIGRLGDVLANATKRGLNDLFASILDEAEHRTGLARNKLEQYFKVDLDFSWTAKHQQALEKYELLCRQNGMIENKKILA